MSEPRSEASRSRLSTLANLTTVLAVIVVFSVSSMALTALGIDYSAPGGNPLSKLHPANLLFALAFLLNVLSKSSPPAYLMELPRRFPGVGSACARGAADRHVLRRGRVSAAVSRSR